MLTQTISILSLGLMLLFAGSVSAFAQTDEAELAVKLDQFISDSTILPGLPAERRDFNPLNFSLSWRLQRNRAAEELYHASPKKYADCICEQFADVSPNEAFLLGLACSPDFLPNIGVKNSWPWEPDRIERLKRLEPLREVQCKAFVSNQRFRNRYLHLCVWETEFLGHYLTNEHYQQSSLLVRCFSMKDLVTCCEQSIADPATGYRDIPHCMNLQCLLLMSLTSRADLVKAVESGKAVPDVFSEWATWFKGHHEKLVQRRDYLGWTSFAGDQVESPSSPGVLIAYPALLLPESPLPGGSVVDPELRKAFSY